MKNKWILRTASALACGLLLSGVLVACGTPNADIDQTTEASTTTAPEVKTMQITVNQYALIRPDLCPQAAVDAAVLFNSTTNEKTGAKFAKFSDDFVKDESEIDSNAYEILIGATNRPESAEALKDISYGYVIKKIGNKIVINSTVSSLLNEAVTYFLEQYLIPTAGDGVFAIPEELNYVQASPSCRRRR